MWSKLSIKLQLIIFMTLVVSIVEISTLFIIHNLQKNESQKNAIVEVNTVTKSLNNDLIKFILNPNADMLSDITYRLLAFKKVNGLVLYDENKKAIFKYAHIEDIQKSRALYYRKTSLILVSLHLI